MADLQIKEFGYNVVPMRVWKRRYRGDWRIGAGLRIAPRTVGAYVWNQQLDYYPLRRMRRV